MLSTMFFVLLVVLVVAYLIIGLGFVHYQSDTGSPTWWPVAWMGFAGGMLCILVVILAAFSSTQRTGDRRSDCRSEKLAELTKDGKYSSADIEQIVTSVCV